MKLQKSWIRCVAVAMILGVAGLASAAVVRFSYAVSIPGIDKDGRPAFYQDSEFIGTDDGTLKGHIHTKSGKVHAIARGTVKNKSGERFHTDDTAAIGAFTPGSIPGYTLTLKRAHFSVSKGGRALFLGTFQATAT